MSIIKVSGSPYYYSRWIIHGKTFQKSTKTRNKQQALKVAEEHRREALESTIEGDTISIKRAFDMYATRQRGIPNLLISKGINLNDKLHTITTRTLAEIKVYMESDGKSPTTIHNNLGFISRVIKTAKKNGYKVSLVDIPRVKPAQGRLRYLSLEEERMLLESLQPDTLLPPYHQVFQQDNHDFILFLLDTGCRRGEGEMVKWGDIDWGSRTISIYRTKTKNESILALTDRLFEVLRRRYLDIDCVQDDSNSINDGFIFGYRTWTALRRHLHELLPGVVLHTMRHTFASRCAQGGVDLYVI